MFNILFQGFFCNDNEIRYPYVHDTVPAGLLDWVFVIVGTAAVSGSLLLHLYCIPMTFT